MLNSETFVSILPVQAIIEVIENGFSLIIVVVNA